MATMRFAVMLIACTLISQDLSMARQDGAPSASEPVIIPTEPNRTPTAYPANLYWGDDVTISSAYLALKTTGQVRCVADTVGGIFVAFNEKYQDTLSRILVYRSTDNGHTWLQIGGFRFMGYAVQSFDMCIADSSSGNWLLGLAMATKTDSIPGSASQPYERGGTLWWGSMLSDGSHWRAKAIATMNASRRYKDPSICTNAEGASVSTTRFFVAAVQVSRVNDHGVGVYVNSSTNWGVDWADPDTSIRGEIIQSTDITVDRGTNPDSLCIAYEDWTNSTTGMDIYVARNTYLYSSAWGVRTLALPDDEGGPSIDVNHFNGDMAVSFDRAREVSPGDYQWDAMYCFSGNQFRAYTLDSIATTAASEYYPSVTWSRSGTNYHWRVAYTSYSGGTGTVYIKSMLTSIKSFHDVSATRVNQFSVSSSFAPAPANFREDGGTTSRLCCAFVGSSSHNIYFDASSLTLDVPRDGGVPATCQLLQNYPNPFNPKTAVSYQLSVAGRVRLAIHDMLGREVAVLVDEQKQPGEYTATWDASGMASGMYFYTLEANGFRETKKLVLLR